MMSFIQRNLPKAIFAALLIAIQATAAGLLAPVYPGAVPDPNAGDITVRVFLSKAPLDKVMAFYTARLGKMMPGSDIESDAAQFNCPADQEVPCYAAEVMDQSQVARQLRDMTQAKVVGVMIQGKAGRKDQPPPASGDKGDDAMGQKLAQMEQKEINAMNREINSQMTPADRKIAAMSDLFEGLKDEVAAGRHTKQELLAAYKRYQDLETAWFPTVKAPNGQRESYDQFKLAHLKASITQNTQTGVAPAAASGQDMAALAKRMQAAVQAGRMDEVQALERQMQSQMQQQPAQRGAALEAVTKDYWNQWMAFLRDLRAHAYRTRIWINTPPKSWGY